MVVGVTGTEELVECAGTVVLVVVVTAMIGGGLGCNDAFGGGLIGRVNSLPNTLTSSC